MTMGSTGIMLTLIGVMIVVMALMPHAPRGFLVIGMVGILIGLAMVVFDYSLFRQTRGGPRKREVKK